MRRLGLLALLLVAFAGRVGAEGTSTTVVWLPIRPLQGAASSWAGANAIRCVAVVAELGITNATRMGWYVTGGLGGGGKCSFAIYNADASSLIQTSGNVDCSTTGKVEATGLSAFSIVAGTKYQVCTCANSSGGNYLAASSVSSEITSLENALSVPIGSMTTSTCTDGAMPSSLNALTAAAANVPILLLGQ